MHTHTRTIYTQFVEDFTVETYEMWMLLEKIKGNGNVVNVKRINAHEAHTWIGMVHISKMCDPMVYFYFQSIL